MGYRFTIAEDEASFAHLIQLLVAHICPDASFALFEHAEDALEYILTNGTDVLVTDNRMLTMTGIELIRELRQRGITIPIIMISGDPRSEQPALAAGATQFLDKGEAFEFMAERIYRLAACKNEPKIASQVA